MNKKRVAVCLSGEPRNSMFCFPYIWESLIKLGPSYKVDVYIHSWKHFRALGLYEPKDFLIQPINGEMFMKERYFTLKKLPNRPNTQKLLDELSKHTFNSSPFKNYLLMYLSMQQCFNLIKIPYDIYIRGRFDFYTSYPHYFERELENIQENKYDIFLPHLIMNNTRMFSDQLAICNLKAAKYYFNMFPNINDLIEQTNSLNTHHWLEEYLTKSNLNIKSSMCPELDLVRSSKAITIYDTPYYEH